jgi:hypothetical protein
MGRVLAVLLASLIGAEPALLQAQGDQVAPASPRVASASPVDDVFSASFGRVRRALGEQRPSTTSAPLKLDFYVEVVGEFPTIQLFTPQELAAGPVPGGPPTHWDMVGVMTPPEFKAQAVPISTLVMMGFRQIVNSEIERQRKQREVEQRRKDDEKRRLYVYEPGVEPPR